MKKSSFRIILLSFLFTFCFAEDKYSYINITSNVKGADLYVDGVQIGKTPVYSYKVFSDTPITIEGSADKKYYPKNLIENINVEAGTHPTVYLQFKKGKGTIIFKGEDAHLYIDKKFITTFDKYNRHVMYEAKDNIEIEISTNDKRFNTKKDLYAGETIEISYELKKVNLDENLFTLIDNELMWQDNPEAKTKNLIYEDAQIYCDKLELAGYTDWEIPSIEQLKRLYEIKENLYNGIGAKAYWSTFQDLNTSHIWKYADTLNFENGKIERKVQSFFNGNIRCVRVRN